MIGAKLAEQWLGMQVHPKFGYEFVPRKQQLSTEIVDAAAAQHGVFRFRQM